MNPERITILVVEDDPDIAQGTSRVLEKAGYATVVALNGAKALEALRASRPDMVLLDRDLPDGDGLEMCRQLKGDPSGADLFVILISGTYTQPEEQVNGLESGADGYLVRPIGNRELVARLETFFRLLRLTHSWREQARVLQASNEKLRESEALLSFALEANQTGVWDFNLLDHTTHRTLIHDRIFGYQTLLPSWTYELFLEHVLPEDRPEVDRGFRAATAAKSHWDFECRIRRADDEVRWIQVSGEQVRNPEGKAVWVSGLVQDITERKRTEEKIRHLNRVYALLSKINETIVRVRDRQTLFGEACRIAVEDGKLRAAWIGLLDEATGEVRVAAKAGALEGYLEGLRITIKPEAEGLGPMGTAVREGRHVISNDIEHDESFAPWRAHALDRGFRSVGVFPLKAFGHTLGGFVLYAGEPGFFDEEEVKLLDELASDISFAVEFMEQEERRKQTEETLRLRDRAIDAATEGICIITPAEAGAELIYVNQGFERMTGYRADEVLGRDMWFLLGPETDPAAIGRLRTAVQAGEASTLELLNYREDGTPFWNRLSITPVTSDAGVVTHFVGVLNDVTPSKEIELALRRSEARLKEAQTLGAIGDWEFDVAAQQISWSPQVFKLYERDPAQGQPSYEEALAYYFPQSQARLDSCVKRAIETGERWEIELHVRLPNGREAWHYGAGAALKEEHGKVVRLVGMVQDITGRKLAELDLRQSQHKLRALSARLETLREEERTRISREIHDELGQMLTGIKMDLRSMEHSLEDFGDDRRVNPILDKLLATAKLTDATVKTVQRIAAELRPGILDKLGLPTALEYEAAQFETRTGTTCRVMVSGDVPPLPPDAATACFRIFQEALTNVARHAKATIVETELKLEAGGYHLEIRDNGRGLSAEDIAKPTALGLLGMQERARLVGGDLSFGAPPSGGTILTVQIPHRPATQEKT